MSVVKPATVKASLHWGGGWFNRICVCPGIFGRSSIQDLHTAPQSICESVANRQREGRPFLTTVNVITFKRLPRNGRYFESK